MIIDDVSVKVKIVGSDKLLAQAQVIFGDLIETKGWRIMPSHVAHPKFQEKLWIQPPVYKAGFKWHPLVFVTDELLYGQIEEKIYNTYQSVRRNTPPDFKPTDQLSNEEAEIKEIDIPF